MFKLFKLRTELIEAQREENQALKKVIFHLKKEVEILDKIRKMDDVKILKLEDELERQDG